VVRYYGHDEGGSTPSDNYAEGIILALTIGVLSGIMYSILDLFYPRKFLRLKSFGFIVVTKSIFFLIFFILISLVAKIQIDVMQGRNYPGIYESLQSILISGRQNTMVIFLYTSVFAVFLNFMQQIDRKYGPGVLFNVFIGKYHKPREEYKLFMFLDIKSSTAIAEKLGHLKYSELMQDFFYDLSDHAYNYFAWIYQYVGDEAVMTWDVKDHKSIALCLKLYFRIKEIINKRSGYYMRKYGVVPSFRAGIHMGLVTVAEVGKFKREIAYHGGTINLASRIQHKSKILDKDVLISRDVYKLIEDTNLKDKYKFDYLGEFSIIGKKDPIGLISVELK
jgi:adenylate cyclase